MRLAFSTLGVPTMPVDDVARLAADHDFHGVELRTDAGGPVHPGLTAGERSYVARQFTTAGVEVAAVVTTVRLAAGRDDAPALTAVGDAVRLASDLGAPYVRVFPGGGDQPAQEADARAARRLAAAAQDADRLGVKVLLATHDSHPGGADVARVLGLVGHRAAGAIWDVMHTWLAGEQPSTTYPELAPYLGYVQVKDIASAEDTTPLPLGEGVLPLAETIEVLSRAYWDGWLSWEYERRWYPQVAELPGLLDPARALLIRLLAESA